MTRPVTPITGSGPGPSPGRPGVGRPGVGRPGVGRSIGSAAVLIAALTILARLTGFGRQLVFAHTVGNSCLGSAYATANQVPNIIYDIVLGGALASIMVPVLAGPAERSRDDPDAARQTSQIASALLTWTILVLVPVSAALALAARPVISFLIPRLSGCAKTDAVVIGSHMLLAFAPQILLYGLAVVLYGILQAHRRFTAPALAPVLSSLVVIAAYVAFVPLGSAHTTNLAGLSSSAELTLAIGTTAGVATLVVTALVPAAALRLRLRPALRFPDGVARRARRLAWVGIAALIAQDASAVVVTLLANGHAGSGAVVRYGYAWQMFITGYAVLAIPIAVSAFPELSARAGTRFDVTAAGSTRSVLLASWLGAALLVGAAVPVARLFVADAAGADQLALTLAAFAPGLVGYGLVACLSRVLLADGRNRVTAAALTGGWLLVIAADIIVVQLVPARWVVPVLGLGNTAGMTASAIALIAGVRRARGLAALAGTVRAAAAGLAGALAGAAAGAASSAALPVSGFIQNAGLAALACTVALVAFGVVAYALDGGDLRAVTARVLRRAAP